MSKRLPADLKDAAEHVLSHAHGLRAILTIAEHVKAVEAIEQAASEAESRRDTARANAEKFEARIADATSKEGQLAKDQAEAKHALTDAKAKAAQIIEAATADAAVIAADATAAADALKAEAVAIKNKALTLADDELLAKRAAIDAAENTLADLEAATAEVQRKADDARAYLASLKV